MRVISKRRLVEFWASRKTGDESRLAERDLSSWLTLAKGADWDNFGALKQTFGTADAVGNCVVFDVGNNRFRLVGRINYHAHIIYVLKVMDHAEYDKKSWVQLVRLQRPAASPTRSVPAAKSGQEVGPSQVTEMIMGVRVAIPSLPDTYFDLVKKFPLVHISDFAHLEAASTVIDDLLRQNLDEGGQAYLGALTDLVEVFEDENVTIPDASESDVLRELMNANRLSQTRLAKEVRISQSTLSAVLNGTRSLTKAHIARLARFFNVPASVFLPA